MEREHGHRENVGTREGMRAQRRDMGIEKACCCCETILRKEREVPDLPGQDTRAFLAAGCQGGAQ